MALVCGVCKQSLIETHDGKELKLLHTPCGHVFHNYCILHYFRTLLYANIESLCPNCKTMCESSDLTQIYPQRRDEGIDIQPQKAAPNQPNPFQTQIIPENKNFVSWKHFVMASFLFLSVLLIGKSSLEKGIANFESGEDELHDSGRFLDGTWAVLFLAAGAAAILFDKYM